MKHSSTPVTPLSCTLQHPAEIANCHCQSEKDQPYQAPQDLVNRILRYSRSVEQAETASLGRVCAILN